MRHLIAICSLAVLVGLSQVVVGAPMPTVDTPTPGGDIIVHKAPIFDVTSTDAGPNALAVDWSRLTDLSGAVMTATLTVVKVVMNDAGGTLMVSDFPLFVDLVPTFWGLYDFPGIRFC